MARTFGQDTSGDRVFTTGTPVTAYPYTVFAWYKPVVAVYGISNGRTVMCNADSASALVLIGVGLGVSGTLQNVARGTEGVFNNNAGSRVVTAGEWVAIAGSYTSSTVRTGYLTRLSDTTVESVAGTGTATLSAGMNRIGIGAFVDNSPNQECDGDVAHPAVWNVALTADEITALSVGRISPLRVRPESLVFYDPYLGRSATEIDIIQARAITVTGTTTTVDNPPVNLPW